MSGWIGVDLDGTLATYDPSTGINGAIGQPTHLIHIVRDMLALAIDVRIVTARVATIHGEHIPEERQKVIDWLATHGLPRIPVVAEKDFGMLALLDDRAVGVHHNKGIACSFCVDRLGMDKFFRFVVKDKRR